MRLFLRGVSLVLVGAGLALIIYLRIVGLHLTEGELLVEYLPYGILSAGLLLVGSAIFLQFEVKP